jgi:AcrR family transcriptional regulator
VTGLEPGEGATSALAKATKGERTRKAIVRAAIVRFSRDGYRRASLTGIARDVGLSPSAIYPYFADKEALFVAAVDEDAAGEIEDGLAGMTGSDLLGDWGQMMADLLDALERHPLAKRVLAGLEPEFTVRLIGIPALEELRKSLAANLETLQMSGEVRADASPQAMATGLVTISLSLLMSLVQTGSRPIDLLGDDVAAVLDAALRPPDA